MNYNLPIVSSNCKSGPNEILANGQYGFLTPVNDTLSLSKKISYVLKNYKIAKNKSNLGHKSLKRFEIKSQCLKYEKYINNLFWWLNSL